jgi:hypothetical protein
MGCTMLWGSKWALKRVNGLKIGTMLQKCNTLALIAQFNQTRKTSPTLIIEMIREFTTTLQLPTRLTTVRRRAKSARQPGHR